MPIQINFLAEQQEAEELRRRDPLKRTILGGVALVVLVLVWCGLMQFKVMKANAEAAAKDAQAKSLQKNASLVQTNIAQIKITGDKIKSLEKLAVNRTLWGSILNALQQTAMEQVQLTSLKVEQRFEEFKPKRPGGKLGPPTAAERISFIIEAKDFSSDGESYNKFKDALLANALLKDYWASPNGISLKDLQRIGDTTDPGKSYISFVFVCTFQERQRQ